MNEFDKELLNFYVDITQKYSELANKLTKIINEQNSKIKEAIDLINYDYSYDSNAFEDRKFQKDLLQILERKINNELMDKRSR